MQETVAEKKRRLNIQTVTDLEKSDPIPIWMEFDAPGNCITQIRTDWGNQTKNVPRGISKQSHPRVPVNADTAPLKYFESMLKEKGELNIVDKFKKKFSFPPGDWQLDEMSPIYTKSSGAKIIKIYGFCPFHGRTHQRNPWWIMEPKKPLNDLTADGNYPSVPLPGNPYFFGCLDSEPSTHKYLFCYSDLEFLFDKE